VSTILLYSKQWDLRKALNLANKGNAVIQEWLKSPIVYQQSASYEALSVLVDQAFNPIASYHHYRSMAKKAYADIEQSEQKKLKRFFYFARATLSAKWIAESQTMPSIVFFDLVQELLSDKSLCGDIAELVRRKLNESEKSNLKVPIEIYNSFTDMFESLEDNVVLNRDSAKLISNRDFREFLNDFD